MGPTMYLYMKAREAYYYDLRHELQQRRLLAGLPQHHQNISRHAAGKIGVLLLKLGMWLKQLEQSPTAFDDQL